MSGYGHNKTTKKQKGWNVKDSVSVPDPAPTERVDLRVPDFDKLINQKGTNVKIFRSMYCPNVKSTDAAEHQVDCAICNGSGYIDVDPICVMAFIQTQELEKIIGDGGYHDGNTVLMTFPIGVELQYFTLVELEKFTHLYYQRVLRKSATDIDILKYKACRVNVIISSDGTRYFQDQDFKIDANGNIKWIGRLGTPPENPEDPTPVIYRKPDDDVIYSIHYETHVQFRAVKAMHTTRFTQYKAAGSPTVEHIKLPEQWMLTKEFLLRRKDINTGNDLIEGPFDDHSDTTGDNS